jgi:hypothetical protein
MRLRDGGTVEVGDDGLYRLHALGTAALPAIAAPGSGLATAGVTAATCGNAVVLVAVGALATCCVGAAIWAARRAASCQAVQPVATRRQLQAWPGRT